MFRSPSYVAQIERGKACVVIPKMEKGGIYRGLLFFLTLIIYDLYDLRCS